MKCVEVEQQMDSLFDGELDVFYRKQVENHLEMCHACRLQFEKLQTMSGLVKNIRPVLPSTALDARVLEAFQRYQNNQPKKERSAPFWAVVFGQMVIPKPVFALSLLGLVVLTGLAFQLGRMSAANTSTRVLSPPENVIKSEINPPLTETSQTKIVEVPVTRFVKIPVVKEKIITRIIYKNGQPGHERMRDGLPNQSAKVLINNSLVENEFMTQGNLRGYKPVSNLKIKVTKAGATNED